MRVFLSTILIAAACSAGTLKNPSVERTAAGVYRFEFEARDAGTIQVRMSADPRGLPRASWLAASPPRPVCLKSPSQRAEFTFT
jgi:hypothetical protein